MENIPQFGIISNAQVHFRLRLQGRLHMPVQPYCKPGCTTHTFSGGGGTPTGSMSPDVLGFEISNLNKCKLYQ